MIRYSGYGLGLLLLAAGIGAAATTASDGKDIVALDAGTVSRIAMAKESIAKNPAQPDSYVSLALALLKAARATDRSDYLDQAEQAVNDALRVATDKNGGNFEAHKTLVAVRLA